MSAEDEDKPTVVLDLNALKKQKLKQEEELASLVQDLEFGVGAEETSDALQAFEQPQDHPQFTVILFDFQSDYFQKNRANLPAGYDYKIASDLVDLNKFLGSKKFQIVVFNYDVNPKAVNQLSAQVKRKFPFTKTLIIASSISPKKAKIHAQTKYGAGGYYQLPFDSHRIETEFSKIYQGFKTPLHSKKAS